jgi:hypothetical protein
MFKVIKMVKFASFFSFAVLAFLIEISITGQKLDSTDLINKPKKKCTISGTIVDGSSGETMPYSSIGILGENYSAMSNQYGFYSLTIPAGKYYLVCKYVGYNENQQEIILEKDLRVNIELKLKSQEMEGVVVTARNNDLKSIERRMSKIDMKTIKELPALGEADLLRSMQLLPGVNSVAEVGGGMEVRGGGGDQNLMLLDEAIVYNANHLVGMYSTFNPDIIKDVKFYKSGIPASYGGRLSSVIDVTQKDGNMKSLHATAGIGIIASKLTLEGPIAKDKSSFIIAVRRSYIDLFFKYFPNDNVKDVKTYFYDLNSKVNYIINENNRVYLSCYLGNDLTGQASYNEEYGNITSTLRYNHIFSNKLFSNTSLIFSKYNMANNQSSELWSWKNNVGLDHYEFKNEFTYFTSKHKIEFGLKGIYYTFYPGDLEPVGDSSKINKIEIPKQFALESAIYLNDNYQINPKIEIQYGIRISNYNYLGPSDVYKFADNVPKDLTSITDTLHYKRNEVIQYYYNFEPRLSVKYSFNENNAVKLSYNKMVQYIQQITNSMAPQPYDMWKASNNYIKPLKGDQFAIGYFSEFLNKVLEFSIEGYYKILQNVIDIKPGTDISLNNTLDAGLLQGKGKAYGLEIMVNKTRGKLTGMISYTWSRTLKKIDGNFQAEKINSGNYYPADYDIPNKLALSGEYKVNNRLSFTADFTFSSGRPITLPSGQYIFFNTLLPYYSVKNSDRLPPYHRLDMGAVLYSKHKENRKWEGFWTFSIYNLYGRENTYSLYIRRKSNSQNTEAVKIWMISIVPSLSYCIKF